ncbi:MAG: alpha-amylase family glycosyl hydrolase [Bacteroidota bacterium]
MVAITRYFILFTVIMLFGCKQEAKYEKLLAVADDTNDDSNPPEWAKSVIWYELAVERFRNGDTTNDPTAEDIQGSYPGFVPKNWSVTPWTQDWYTEDGYFNTMGYQRDSKGNTLLKFVDKVQLRRYGGDLQGVLDKMDYLDSLGVTAIYFRPINDAPSLHKYDARNWRHVDVNFGPNPELDKEIIASEIPEDPSTWKMTEADKLFLRVLDAFHARGIKVILDYSWNHTGTTFWAWNDILENQEQSKYKDWFWIDTFDNPNTSENEFEYHGWSGVPSLPEIRETNKQDLSNGVTVFDGDIYSEEAKKHILNVTKRWLDPNGDGDPSDGVDGYRLDVAAETPLGFWRDFRAYVREINPNAYLLGEIWWEDWPDKLLDPEPFLRGDIFDAVMNYRWYRVVRHFFNESPNTISTSQLIDSLNSITSNIREGNNYAMMNYTGGFDTPRLLTSLFNKNVYKYHCKVHENPDYKIHRPDEDTYQTLKLLLIQQYTYMGSPHIYAGDEMGMWGADDPSCRKPLIWKDYSFEDEKAHPMNKPRPVDKVQFNEEHFHLVKDLINLRKTNPVLVYGQLEFINPSNADGLFSYRRYDANDEILVVFNHKEQPFTAQFKNIKNFAYKDILSSNEVALTPDGNLQISLQARSAAVLKKLN